MPKNHRFIKQPAKFYRSLVATALLANGVFQFVAPVLAEGTAAGQSISNTATATYEDPSAPGTTINATSNTVTVTVAEVAGITVVASGVPTDSTPATPISVGDTLTYTYTVTNVGNDPTKFRIPNLATTTGPAAVSGNLQYFNGTAWVDITGTELITSSIPVNGTVQVRVNVAVQPGANANDIITVQLGDTPGNAQNVARVNNGGDVYTVDNADGDPGEIFGAPANGTREASAKQQSTVGAVAKNLALATLLKTRTAYNDNGTAGNIADDKVTYGLSLRVEGNDVTGKGITPQPLAGYAGISVDADTSKNYILVSDVIPTGTALAATPTAPAGWTPVYSTDNTSNPNSALWTTTLPTGGLANVKRVGFVKQTTNAASYIPVNTTVTGFSIQVAVTGTPTTLSVNNIAQLVGQTPGTGGLPVYDESGDQNPNNYDGPVGNMTPGAGVADTNNDGLPDSAAAVTGNITNGVADPNTQGVDASNDNTGSGSGGEVNVLAINAATPTSVLNGPLNAPSATGPDGTTATDFTNKSSFIPAGTNPGSKIDPQAVGFSNTFQNNGTSSGTVTLAPTVPANKLDLPDGTKVTITYGGNSAVYTYSQTGAGSFTITGTAISIPSVAAGASIGYGVEVDLPAGTKLSTDTLPDYTGDTEWGYPVPITSTITVGSGGSATTATNITTDRVFTGYLQLIKVSRILQGSGEPVVGTQGDFESTPSYVNLGPNGVLGGGDDVIIDPNGAVADVPRTPTPGNIIEYQIRYKNISNVQAGVGNVILNADKVVITEDGTAGSNNWAKDNDTNGIIDTSNVTNPQAVDSNSGTITFSPSVNQSGTTAATDVTKYVDTVNGLVIPQEQGTFTFQRKVN